MLLWYRGPKRAHQRVETVRNRLYTRRRFISSSSTPCVIQVLTLNASAAVETSIEYDQRALDFDFRKKAVRPDIGRATEPRPGIYLHERLSALDRQNRESILVNGNNLGYWGNQYAISGPGLVWKRRGAIFDDGRLDEHASAQPHTFLCAQPVAKFPRRVLADEFSMQEIKLAAARPIEDSGVWIWPNPADKLPRTAISGLPLLSQGKPVWRAHITDAWDPRLIFEGAAIVGLDRSHIAPEFTARKLLTSGKLARHAMTVVGLDRRGRLSIVVAERSRRSKGITIEDAARFGMDFGLIDAIVLGAAGDAQLGSTAEGVLIDPLIESHVASSARTIPPKWLAFQQARQRAVKARPVPCVLRIDHLRPEDDRPTQRMPAPSSANFARYGVLFDGGSALI